LDALSSVINLGLKRERESGGFVNHEINLGLGLAGALGVGNTFIYVYDI
jgi:hypothetical protein